MLPILLAFTALAEDMTHLKHVHGCDLSMRAETHPEGAAMRADCVWPDVQLSTLQNMLSDFARYADFIWPIDLAEARRQVDDRTLVYQLQEIWGISDREVLLWMSSSTLSDGTRFQWTTAAEEPLTLRPGAIRTPKNEGYWEVRNHPDGGVQVVHEIAVDAGGSVPKWVIRLVRTRGFARVMGEVREYAAKRPLTGPSNDSLVPQHSP